MAKEDPGNENCEPTADLPIDGTVRSTVSGQYPSEIGGFRILRVIASGGMGTVYQATQKNPHRAVAVKVLRAGIGSSSSLRRFEYESKILARLRHPGIAQVYEAGQHRDAGGTVPFFAMEYVPAAKPIHVYANRKSMDSRERLVLFLQVCHAVQHGHLKGIIHRDLKPSNILVDGEGRVKVIDYGVARCTDSDMSVASQRTAVGEMVGTLKYMSPEQCEADPDNIDARSDVYELGVVLFELLSGQSPYALDKTPILELPRVIRDVPP